MKRLNDKMKSYYPYKYLFGFLVLIDSLENILDFIRLLRGRNNQYEGISLGKSLHSRRQRIYPAASIRAGLARSHSI